MSINQPGPNQPIQPATNQANQAIQTAPSTQLPSTIDLPLLQNPDETLEVMAENLQQFKKKMHFNSLKVPSGGGLSFKTVGDDGKTAEVSKLTGIILDYFYFSAWWEIDYDKRKEDDDKRPNCWSKDFTHGSGCHTPSSIVINANQECKSCKYGIWGSDRRGGRGKDCNDRIRIHILCQGDAFPTRIDLPVMSHDNFETYLKLLTGKAKFLYGVVTEITLANDKNKSGIEYSKAVFSRGMDLTPAERKSVKGYLGISLDEMRALDLDSIAEGLDETGSGNNTAAGSASTIGDINKINFNDPGQGLKPTGTDVY
jgi:hypothetical protein